MRGPLVRALSSPPLRVLGLLSFGIYLWHWPLLHIFDTEPVVVPLGLTLLLASASYLAVERPVLSGWPRPKPAAWLGAGAIALTIVLVAALAVLSRHRKHARRPSRPRVPRRWHRAQPR